MLFLDTVRKTASSSFYVQHKISGKSVPFNLMISKRVKQKMYIHLLHFLYNLSSHIV
jgi:hypothetical protein